MVRKMDLGDIVFSPSSSGLVVSKKDDTHLTFCVKKAELNAHITNERTNERESLFATLLGSFVEWVETIFSPFFIQLLHRYVVTEDWLMDSALLFQRLANEDGSLECFEEFFEKRQGAYRLRAGVDMKLVGPEELKNGGYIVYTEDKVFRGGLIVLKPLFFFIPLEEIYIMLCTAEETFFRTECSHHNGNDGSVAAE